MVFRAERAHFSAIYVTFFPSRPICLWQPRSERHIAPLLPRGCPAAARLQKLLWRPSVPPHGTPRAAFVQWPRVEPSEIHRKVRRSEGLIARRAFRAQHSPTRRRQRAPPSLAFCPSDFPVKNLARARWPGFATEVSLLGAARVRED